MIARSTGKIRNRNGAIENEQWMDYSKKMPINKTSISEELLQYLQYALTGLDVSCMPPTPSKNGFSKPAKRNKKSLQDTPSDNNKKDWEWGKESDCPDGNWSNLSNSIMREHCRGAVKEPKGRLKGWGELVEVDEFWTSNCAAVAILQQKKSSTTMRRSTVFSIAWTMSVE